jgi:DAK2 domain fusion protein YloV
MLAVTVLDGLGFTKFIAAGTYFLKKYRVVLNDLNVFPVPDGDTGSNLYLTARSALLEAGHERSRSLGEVADAAARGALLGARGNSGVILSQMFRGFADAVGGKEAIAARELGAAFERAVEEARAALHAPVEGTILSVATAAAEEAVASAAHASELYELGDAIVRAANSALERTPQQLAALREAGVVDAGAAGLLYFLEGILRFAPATRERVTSYPRGTDRTRVFNERHEISANKYCAEFVLSQAAIEARALKERLIPHGDSLLVAGGPPTLRVHIHTDVPHVVQSVAAKHGIIERVKIEDMQQQHRVLAERPKRAFSFVAIVPGLGFERIARELGADAAIVAQDANASGATIAAAIRASSGDVVVVLADDSSAIRAAETAGAAFERAVVIVPTRSAAESLAVLVEYGGRIESGPIPSRDELEAAARRVRTTTIGAELLASDARASGLEDLLEDAALRLGADKGGLVTLYYGGSQGQRDAELLTNALRERMPKVEFEWFFGGQRTSEYVVAFER